MNFQAWFRILLLSFFLFSGLCMHAQQLFDSFFTGERLRIDYTIQGNANTCEIVEKKFMREPFWGGNRINLIDTFGYGEMMAEIYDSASGELLYSRGYSTLFKEWQTIDEAKRRDSIFIETILLPFPRNTIRIEISERTSKIFAKIRTFNFNPEQRVSINTRDSNPEVLTLLSSGNPEKKLDIALLAEGYTYAERDSFINRAVELMNQFLSWEPYASYSNSLNFYAVFITSEESGTDDPCDSIRINTALNTSFNTFGSDRYLTSTNMQGIYDMVASLPYDQLCIIVNTPKYGGGAIYNYFTFISGHNRYSEFLFQHEFGHAFASLADEYYTSEVAYTEYFQLDIEPYQPNITTLLDFGRKWEAMLTDNIPVPTPDSIIYTNSVGVFEGAGYCAKDIYRPSRTCAMKDKHTSYFCPVCRKAIADMILFQTAE